jgi:dienelactone hydrolase
MSFYRGMTCENVTIKGDKGTSITAYVARPSGPGPFPGVVLVHHLPGWSELYIAKFHSRRSTNDDDALKPSQYRDAIASYGEMSCFSFMFS